MYTTSTNSAAHREDLRSGIGQGIRSFLLRKLWLPRIVYELLPYIYIAVGLLAVFAATRIPNWTWLLPYAALLGLICVHAGLGIAMLRYRFRHTRRARD